MHGVNRSVTFNNALIGKTSLSEMTIYIAGEDEGARWHPVGPLSQQGKTVMRHDCAIERQPVSIKAPCEPRIGQECLRVGDVFKGETGPAQRRVRSPEPFLSPEVRQPRIDAHTCPGCDQKPGCLLYPTCSPLQLFKTLCHRGYAFTSRSCYGSARSSPASPIRPTLL